MVQQLGQLDGALTTEGLVFDRSVVSALTRRPVFHDWCAARSQTEEMTFYFCDWLDTPTCAFFQCADVEAGCERCTNGEGVCAKDGAAGMPSVELSTAMAVEERAPTPEPAKAQTTPATARAPAPTDGWALPLGSAYDLRAVSRALDSFGAGSFQVDYELKESTQQPAIRGDGLFQTYLIFGGPGAGKTYFFQYLLSSLLAHPRRPGCLLLDPKGVLTPWLSEVLQQIGRNDDLTVLAAGASENAFNVLGDDLPPHELGRLLSEVVLAGAAGIDEGWQVLISDLLEAAAVVISADPKTHLTASSLLRDILYRRRFKYGDGSRKQEYPIVIRAARLGRETKDPDLRIASDRIAEYFSSTEPRQRRFVRQIIERSLGELMSRDWAYLSAKDAGSVYSGIIDNGRVVTVAVGQGSPAFQRSMSTLVKSIFQQAVLADLSRRQEEGSVDEPPFFILACDEYAQAITEGETGLVSDSRFFSLSRQAGCMSLLALQSVATGRSRFPAAMHDRWDGILGNATVKLFMRVNDVETAELGSALAGSQHSFIPVLSQQHSAQGPAVTQSTNMLEHRRVPPWYLTNRMEQGYALVHGTLDGRSAPTSVFVRVPAKS